MKCLTRVRDGVENLVVLAIPVVLVGIGLGFGPRGWPRPGESRLVRHIRCCPSCRVEDPCPNQGGADCAELVVVMEEVREQAAAAYSPWRTPSGDSRDGRGVRPGVARWRPDGLAQLSTRR